MATIQCTDLSLDYPITGMGSRSIRHHILGAATGGILTRDAGFPVVKALRGINFSLNDGDRLGLLGHNGAGKSSLLKVLAGIYSPTSGKVQINGKVVSTLNLSLGMELEATGLENIITRGLLLGMRRREINSKVDEIAAFTELGDFLHMPVRIYSSGMATRLAFATVTAMDADILLMDEVIGTGDESFLVKAHNRLNHFMSKCKIQVLASHSEAMIRQFCNKAVLLEHGQIRCFGPLDDVFHVYHTKGV